MATVGSCTDEVLVEQSSHVKKFILNRPKQLNALSFTMVSQLLQHFLTCEEESNLNLIILKGQGRAFCAGGDVASVVHDINKGNWKIAAEFFRVEYIMNYVMATCSKTQVSILNGIVMGGGAGASIHGRFRVATEKSLFAMPETALGLFPDVGASYYLSRLPGFFGEYVGLTGSRLDGADMLACGLATHFVPSVNLSLLEEALERANSSDPVEVSAVIDKFSEEPSLKKTSVYHRLDVINACFSMRTVEEVISAIENMSTNSQDDWLSSTLQSLKTASPTSLKITLRSIREGRLQSIGQCLVREYRMVCHVVKGKFSKDFCEGCRAILLDKDKNPKWEPSRLELVSDEMVDSYFCKVKDDDDLQDWEDLKLPPRSNLPSHAIAKL
ncbi:3-hydroxyisobutyryl-CoA hydrolase 1-like [Impatiens glandulifera]|uniref:3-hydroxyisobutyryl-CoA hydrolase 1-like n=1 Tax=Impatiens glandulifera TaxID=253017 RepID=UPI001FB0EA9A|nr:3-hydroxyisobutyryl-CoA hydrolase 1-like [Impatiens glandulifera]